MSEPNIKFLSADAVDAIHSATIREQAAELDSLRAENARYVNYSAGCDRQIIELKAENERLREALEQALDDMKNGYGVCRPTKELMQAAISGGDEAK